MGATAARVQSGGRLVEEDDARVPDERHGKVQPAPHATRVGRDHLPGHLEQVEPVEKFTGAAAACTPIEVVKIRHQHEVLLAGEQVVHRRELASDADGCAHRVRVAGRIEAGDANLTGVRVEECREDLHSGGLPGPVGTEQREDCPFRDVEIDAVEHDLVSE